MARMIKRINILQAISMIGMIITLVLIMCNVNNIVNLFWIFVGLSIGGNVMYLDKWGKEGLTRFKKMDSNYNKNYTRKTSELLLFLLATYTMVICIIFLATILIPSFTQDISVIIGFTIFSAVTNAVNLYLVDRTSKEVKETIKKGGNKNAR